MALLSSFCAPLSQNLPLGGRRRINETSASTVTAANSGVGDEGQRRATAISQRGKKPAQYRK